MKLHLVFLSAFASLAACAVAGNSQGKRDSHLSPSFLVLHISLIRTDSYSPSFTEEPGDVEKRDLPKFNRPTGLSFTRPCNRSCESDGDCCLSDTCSPDKRCQGFYYEKFPNGYPVKQPSVNFSDPTEVEKWSKISMGMSSQILDTNSANRIL